MEKCGKEKGEQGVFHGASLCTSGSTKQTEAMGQPQFKLDWTKRADMPIQSSQIRLQAVTIGGEAYVGSGVSDVGNVVLKYNYAKDEWNRITDHTVYDFGLCQFQEEQQTDLYSIGGADPKEGIINAVFLYNSTDKKWEKALTPMPTARFNASVFTTKAAIIVCGGDDGNGVIPLVEVYSSATSQWHTAEPMPQPGWLMSSVTIGGYGYLMGGQNGNDQAQKQPFQADLSQLIERAVSPTEPSKDASIWKTLPATPQMLMYSAAATVNGALLAIGGIAETAQPTVFIFDTENETWKDLPNDLPAGRYLCTATQLPNNQVLVTGGRNENRDYTVTCFLGSSIA